MVTGLKRFIHASIAALVLAMGSASAAQADSTTWLTPEGTKGKYAAEQVTQFKFSYEGRNLTCKTMLWEESFIGTGNKYLPFQPAFTGCETSFGLTATITMKECDFAIKGVPTDPEEFGYLGTTELSCPAGQRISIDVYTSATKHEDPEYLVCQYTVKPQTGLGYTYFENRALQSEKDDIWLQANGVTFKTEVDGSTFFCGASGGEARIWGATTIRAFSAEGSQTKLTVGHET